MKMHRLMAASALLVAVAAGCAENLETVDPTQSPESAPVEPAQEANFDILLPAYELPREKKIPGKSDAYDDYRLANPQWYAITDKPTGNFTYRHMTEWEPMQFLYTTYSDGMPSDPQVATTIRNIVVQTVKEANTKVAVIYETNTAKNDLNSRLLAGGLTQAQINAMVVFVNIKNDTIWHIDYGPVPLVKNDNKIAFADFRYYHQRLQDDAIPTLMSFYHNVNTFRMNVKTEGGNFQGDGEGTCYVSQRGLQYAGMTAAQFKQVWADYLACSNQLVVLKDITDDGTGHIDMFFKLVNKNLAIVGEYKSPYVTDAVNEQRMDDNETLLKATTVAGGAKISVLRMPFPSKSDGIPRTYLNSTFVNNVNLWPIYSASGTKASEAEALQIWNAALPNYKHIGIISDKIAQYSGTIHCITRTIPNGTLSPWIGDGTCVSGMCQAPALGYTGECNANIPCKGPDWQCECNDCNYCDGTAPPQSCENACGGQAPGGCYCDTLCKQYNDCCSDYDQFCSAGASSCQGKCGGQATSGCKCDAACVQNGNCCADYQQFCACQPQCSGKQCGSDGCGGECGICGVNQICTTAGMCQDVCVPKCGGLECGTDGCGGTCGTCAANETCTAGQCVCVPNCSGKECGADGCGGTCGECAGNEVCSPASQCVCVPNCNGKECGPNGCGGTCGTCGMNEACTASGQCEVQVAECVVTGCSSELCKAEDTASVCIADPCNYCLKYSECGNFGANGTCAWKSTAQLKNCLQHCKPPVKRCKTTSDCPTGMSCGCGSNPYDPNFSGCFLQCM